MLPMKSKVVMDLAKQLAEQRRLTEDEYAHLIRFRTAESSVYLAKRADQIRKKIYKNHVYIRGLIEISNICRNDCYYCGIRRSNTACERYRLTKQQILGCCREGYELGFRTFVMQGGEGTYPVGKIADIVKSVKERYSDCAVTLSLGEYTRAEYEIMRDAGADRYLLRHETADREHYRKLHPAVMSWENRMRCLYDLKELGFQVGCGFMVGSPYQTAESLAKDLKFIEKFMPDMCGIGPFIPQRDTPFRDIPAGSGELTVFLLSVIRLIKPNILLPATTALGTIMENGREQGILAGANVIMPNLSPLSERKKYSLYDNKICSGEESAQSVSTLRDHMRSIGYQIITAKGDIIK